MLALTLSESQLDIGHMLFMMEKRIPKALPSILMLQSTGLVPLV